MHSFRLLAGLCIALLPTLLFAQNLVTNGDFGPNGGPCAARSGASSFDPSSPQKGTWIANPTWFITPNPSFDGVSDNCYAKFTTNNKVRLIQGFDAPSATGTYSVSYDYIYVDGVIGTTDPYFWVLGVDASDPVISRFPGSSDGFPQGATPADISNWDVLYQRKLAGNCTLTSCSNGPPLAVGAPGSPVSIEDTFTVSSTFDYWVVVVSYGCDPGNQNCATQRALDNVVIEQADNTPPTITNVRVEPASPVYGEDISLKATATDTESNIASAEYNGGVGWNPMTADDGAFDELSEDVSFTRPTQPVGNRKFFVRATDAAGNRSAGIDPDSVTYQVVAAQLTVTFDGEAFDVDGQPTFLKATVSGGPVACYNGKLITFNVQSDTAPGGYDTGIDYPVYVGSDGKATAEVNLPLGHVYDILVDFPDQNLGGSAAPECLGDQDSGITVVADPNASSTGGGWYKVDGLSPPRVNFGYTARTKYNKRADEWTTSGNVLWMHQNNYRLKGSILNGGNLPDEYCEAEGDFEACAAFSGEGTLYEHNDFYDPYCEPYEYCGMEWVNPEPVNFLFVTHDGGSSKECKGKGNKCKDVLKPDEFGMSIDLVAIDAETDPIELHGGNLVVR
jgi:hypothetical protein